MAVEITAPVLPSTPIVQAEPAAAAQAPVPPPISSSTTKVPAPAIVTSQPAQNLVTSAQGTLTTAQQQMQQQTAAKATAAQQQAAADQAAAAAQVTAQQQALDNKNSAAETAAKIAAMQQQAVAQSSQANQPTAEQLIAKYATSNGNTPTTTPDYGAQTSAANQQLLADIKSGKNTNFYVDAAGVIRDVNTNAPADSSTNTSTTSPTSTTTTNLDGTTSSTPTQSTGNPQLDALVAQKSADSNQAAQAYQDYLSKTQQIQNGTYPLNATQQAMITAVNNTLAQSLATQQQANQAYQGALATQAYSTGVGAFQGIQSGIVKNAIDQGTLKIQDLENTATKAIADLQAGFDTNNLKTIQDSYNAFTTAMAAKDKTITDIYNAVTDNAKTVQAQANNQRDAQALAQKTQFDQQMADRNQSMEEIKNIKDNQIATINALGYGYDANGNKIKSEAAIAQTEKEWKDQQDVRIADAKNAIDLAAKTDPLGFGGNPQTIKDLVNSSMASQTGSGMTYVDLTQFTDPAQKKEMGNAARAAGLPIITSPTELASVTTVDGEQQKLNQLLAMFKQIAPADAGARIGDSLTQWASLGADTPQGQLISTYKGLVGAEVPSLVKALSGLNRVNQPEILNATGALPSADPKTMSTWADAKLKVQALQDTLSKGLAVQFENKVKYSSLDNYIGANSQNKDAFNKVAAAHPDWSPDKALEYLQAPAASSSSSSDFNQSPSTDSNGSVTLGSRLATVNNNPGNLKFVGQQGATMGENGFAKFSSPQAGVQALKDQISLDASRGSTLSDFVSKFAPSSDNNTSQYIQQIATALNVDPSTKLSDLDLNALTKAIAKKESSSNIG